MDPPNEDDDEALRHALYERAVQSPEHDVALLERLFARRTGREALRLREDFCGTGLLAARWVESDDEREAEGVDLDARVLAHGRRRHRARLDPEEAARLVLRRRDVRARSDRTFDLIVAMNFSWALFDDDALARYLAEAAACLEEDGWLVLELFGGPAMGEALVREHAHEGFTYVWEQKGARDGALEAAIHFTLADGRALRDAFRYRFHLRPVDALEAMVRAAGFGRFELLVEDRRGRYARRRGRPRAPVWRGLVLAGAPRP
ncbi:MAG TPA: class I SAM-dependent methyltransferase [Sandaracinaceae bacterium LLY-WYZ-13_1]|nr:class I SAM-dependent methyltransferase [Sandaracinaceae bacterium LLY-WYZ-13_1]